MRTLDLTSTLTAALVGAFLLAAVVLLLKALAATEDETPLAVWLAAGAVVGAGTQTAVRLTGVS